MKRAFKYDVAVSAADFDALAVTELKRRLEQRLSKPVFTVPRSTDGPRTAAANAAIQKAIEKESRVLVVLHQRLWGTTSSSEIEATAVRARIGKVKRKDVLVVPLDTHTIRVGRCLRLTRRASPGWKLAAEITAALRVLDPDDPVRYDFALCHLSMMGACGWHTRRGNARCPLRDHCRPAR